MSTSSNDPFLAQPGDSGMRPVEPSPQPGAAQPAPSFNPDQTFEPGTPLPDSWNDAPPAPEYGQPPVQPAPVQPAPAGPQYGAVPGSPQAPTYAQYPQGYQPGLYPAPRPTKTWMNIVALVSALIGFSLGGVIFGHLGVNAANRGEAEYKGLGIAGLILGYLGLVIGLVYVIAVLAFVTTTGVSSTGF